MVTNTFIFAVGLVTTLLVVMFVVLSMREVHKLDVEYRRRLDQG